ncbi:uncharacterized protein [Narcine bancroftii]|uniref:uncharacterized protein n=1 Tax=Narcine bancroftii TaxID=1343680 RepID=UPI00383183B7
MLTGIPPVHKMTDEPDDHAESTGTNNFRPRGQPAQHYASQWDDSEGLLFDWTLKSGWIDGQVRGLIGSCRGEAGRWGRCVCSGFIASPRALKRSWRRRRDHPQSRGPGKTGDQQPAGPHPGVAGTGEVFEWSRGVGARPDSADRARPEAARPVWLQQVRSYRHVASAAAALPNKETSTQAWASGSITNGDKGQPCLVERVKLNVSEICPFITILAKGILYKSLTQPECFHQRCLCSILN